MSVKVEKLEHNMVRLTVEVPAEQLAAAEDRAYNRQKGKIALPGFRKGKAPRSLIEKMYGPDIFIEDAVNDVLPDAYEAAVKESGLTVVSHPELDYVQVEHGKDLIVNATVAVKPEVTLGEYKGLSVELEGKADVTDEDILAVIDKEREKNSYVEDITDRPVQEGDTVNLDYAGSVDGVPFDGGTAEGQDLVIGSHSFIPGFEEQMIGMAVDEEKDLNVTFPEEYHAKELAGKAAVFHVKVNSIGLKVLPELDDEFASDVSEFGTLEEYKASVRKELEESKAKDLKREKEDKLLEAAVKNAVMDIPEVMIQEEAESQVREFGQRLESQGLKLEQYLQYTGMTMPQIVEQYKENAQKRIAGRLVLEAIAKAEGLEATEEDVQAEYQRLADSYSMDLETVKGYFAEESVASLKEDLATQKALDLLYENAK